MQEFAIQCLGDKDWKRRFGFAKDSEFAHTHFINSFPGSDF